VVDGRFFSFNPATNEIFAMTDTGEVTVASATSEGIDSLELAVAHEADKNIVFITDGPGVAIFDAKVGQMRQQDISWPRDDAAVISAAVYGSRLYAALASGDNIYSYNKTLQGYSGGAAWITAKDFPAGSMVSIAVDGNIYTLHADGSVRQLFKGEEVAFELEAVDPPLAGAKKILTREGGKNIYIFDPAHERIVIYTKDGALVQQVLVDVATAFKDMAISADELTLYALDGTQVLALPLGSEQ
jgi:hypothetical protein